jgi:hypothetical protein
LRAAAALCAEDSDIEGEGKARGELLVLLAESDPSAARRELLRIAELGAEFATLHDGVIRRDTFVPSIQQLSGGRLRDTLTVPVPDFPEFPHRGQQQLGRSLPVFRVQGRHPAQHDSGAIVGIRGMRDVAELVEKHQRPVVPLENLKIVLEVGFAPRALKGPGVGEDTHRPLPLIAAQPVAIRQLSEDHDSPQRVVAHEEALKVPEHDLTHRHVAD